VLVELLQERLPVRRLRRWPRAVKRKMSNFRLRRRGDPPLPAFDPTTVIRIVKWTALGLGAAIPDGRPGRRPGPDD
jgi:hypothetical protein